MRGIIGIQSRREVPLSKGPGVYCNAVIKGQEGQVELGCYDVKIQPYLQIGASVDVEWDEKPGKPFNDQPTTQRTIRQLYVDGKPIVEKQQGKGFGGGGYKDSPETRASIEAQTAVNAVVELINGKAIAVPESLVLKTFAWLESKLSANGKPAPTEKQATKAAPAPTSSDEEFDKLKRPGAAATGYINDLTIERLMKLTGARDKDDLKVKAEVFLSERLPSLSSMTMEQAVRWANSLTKKK